MLNYRLGDLIDIRSIPILSIEHIMPLDMYRSFLDSLVQEFRAWQKLAYLTRMERHALVESDALLLQRLIEQKSSHLTGLADRQRSRQVLLETIDASTHPADRTCTGRTALTVLLEHLSQEDVRRLLHLTDGILSLAEQVGELAQGNYALADCAIRRLWVLQNWIKREEQHSLPFLLSSLLSTQEELCGQAAIGPPLDFPEPAWSLHLDFVDQGFFSDMLALRSAAASAVDRF
jgi:flagellar biosynthesis/type III secretory pathway chaperone